MATHPSVDPAQWNLSEILSEFARTMLTDFPIQRILDHLVHRIVEVMPVAGAGVSLITETSGPRYVAASDSKALAFENLQADLAEGPCLLTYQTGEAVAIPDLHEEGGRFPRFTASALDDGLAAVFTFPLHQSSRRLGALDLYRDTPGPLSSDAMVAAQTLADVASAYLVNAQARRDLVESSASAHAMSLHDALTGLPNRILLVERVEHALLSCQRSEKFVAVFFLDLDSFKRINDNFGHHVGDELLVEISEQVTMLLRPGDTLARLSGDEFIVVCPGLDNAAEADVIASRIERIFSAPFYLGEATVRASASIGIAIAALGDSPEVLLHKADIAMYQVKRDGGATHKILNPEEHELEEIGLTLQRDLSHAMERKELHLEYQPVVRVSDGQMIGVEALLRWEHPDRGVISPTILIPFAEEAGSINEIGRWVLEQACTDLHRWSEGSGGRALGVSVNVSANQLMAPGFVALVQEVIASTATNADDLCLEVTESAYVQDAERAIDVLSRLKSIGVLLALDDFGTGYSSLSYLKDFPMDMLKIDESFITSLTRSSTSHAIVSKTIELAHLLDLLVVCEGVETAEQSHEVALLASDYSQGFFFSQPLTADALCGCEWKVAV